MKIKNKKAELSTQQIVLLIILIASFVIILFFLVRLNLGGETEKEACHQSVVLRGNSAIPADSVPLKCQTNYLCITKDGTCEGLTKPKAEKVKTEQEVYDILANEMADCWWMFGEGDVNYVGKDAAQHLYCSLCTQFILDNSLSEIEGLENGVDEQKFYRYLETKKHEASGDSYLAYLGGGATFRDFEMALASGGGNWGTYDLGKQYYIMMGIYSEVGVYRWVLGGLVVAGGIIAAPFTGTLSLYQSVLILGIGGTAGHFAGTMVKSEAGLECLTPVILEANSVEFDVFDCKNVMTIA